MYSRIGSVAYKKDLTNIRALCEYLDNPQLHFRSIHIGGTNGKGSTSHMLAAVLQTSGYRTGLYTSPHLYDFRERIRVDGNMIPTEFVVDFVERIQPLIEDIAPSFFEITVAMAFEYFALQKIDIAVIEVGLGGRLDSTNIIYSMLSVITNIGLDHMDMLGNTLEAIAAEKAGIIKNDIPVVIGEALPATKAVFVEHAMRVRAPLYFAEEEIKIESYQQNEDYLTVQYSDHRLNQSGQVQTDLNSLYQIKNVRTVLCAIERLKEQGLDINEEFIKNGLSQIKKITGLSGRWDVIQKNPSLILEVAHNEDGIRAMLEQVAVQPFENLHFVIGVVKDKDVQKILTLLPKNASYYFTQASIPRALIAMQLLEQAKKAGLEGAIYENVNSAIKKAKEQASTNDGIIVCGSIFLIAEVDRKQFTTV